MRVAVMLVVGVLLAVAASSRGPRAYVTSAWVEEAVPAEPPAPELASPPPPRDDSTVGARLVASTWRAEDREGRDARERDAGCVVTLGSAVPGTLVNLDEVVAEIRAGPGADEPRVCAEDVRDLVEPNGPYRADSFERWVRDLVVRDAGSALVLADATLRGPATPEDVARVREFLAAQRRRFAPPPAEIEVAAAERASIQVLSRVSYIEEFDVEIAPSGAAIADPVRPPVEEAGNR